MSTQEYYAMHHSSFAAQNSFLAEVLLLRCMFLRNVCISTSQMILYMVLHSESDYISIFYMNF